MMKKISTLLLVAVITAGVGYDCYANRPTPAPLKQQMQKKTGLLSRLGTGVMVVAFGLSLSANVFLSLHNQRVTDSYEQLVGKTRELRDDYRKLVSLGFVSDDASADGISIRRSVISFEDNMFAAADADADAEVIDVEYIEEIGAGGIAFHSVDAYNSRQENLPLSFYNGLRVFYIHDGFNLIGQVQFVADAGGHQFLLIGHGEGGTTVATKSELEGVLVTRHPLYTSKDIDVEFSMSSMASYNGQPLPLDAEFRPSSRLDFDIVSTGRLYGKLIMASTGDNSVVKVVLPNGEEFFVLVPEEDLTAIDEGW